MKLTYARVDRTGRESFPCSVLLRFDGDRSVTYEDMTFEHALQGAIHGAGEAFKEELRAQITLRQDYAIIIDL